MAGVPGADGLLDEAVGVFERRFWDEDRGRVLDEWDRAWEAPVPYRGLNSTMHSLEAFLAVGDATGDPVWHERGGRLAGFVVDLAHRFDGRLPEHFRADWTPHLDLNRDRPDDPFKPYGATVGHGLEWSRLLLHVEATLGERAPEGLLPAARLLFDRAVSEGWHVDGEPGFVYTTDWDGRPVVRQRMHWVAAEGVAAAAALHRRTGEAGYAECAAAWWAYVVEHLRDVGRGSWHHELDPRNRPAGTVWPGKPDLYHAVQATLLPRLPLAPGLARGLALSGRCRGTGMRGMTDEHAQAPARVLVVGEALVDVVPDRDGTPRDLPGGSPANVAIALARLDHDVRLVTLLGDDERGRLVRSWLEVSG